MLLIKKDSLVEKRLNGWSLNFSEQTEKFGKTCSDKAISLLKKWADAFPKEDSWVQNSYGVPSLMVRLDCVRNPDGNLEIFEVEERPAGIGFAIELNPSFKIRFDELRKKWPKIYTVISSRREGHDDTLWAEQISPEKARENGRLLIIRAEPEETDFHPLAKKSVSTLLMKGDKSYGLKMGLWESVKNDDFENFPWKKGFCLKPIKNSKCRDIEIWHPIYRKKKYNGVTIGGLSTRNQIQRTLEKNQKMYLQPFIMPMNSSFFEGYLMAFRVYFGYNPDKGIYDFIGGLWNARKNVRIHGASDTITGPVIE